MKRIMLALLTVVFASGQSCEPVPRPQDDRPDNPFRYQPGDRWTVPDLNERDCVLVRNILRCEG